MIANTRASISPGLTSHYSAHDRKAELERLVFDRMSAAQYRSRLANHLISTLHELTQHFTG